jgi:AbrB family looped-hinge helix DNA binding protein
VSFDAPHPRASASFDRMHYRGNVLTMALAQSKLTSQGQVSVPVEVRRALGLAAGSILEWDAEGDVIVVRRATRFSTEHVHRALFPEGPPPVQSTLNMKDGIRAAVRKRHARG